MRHLRSLLYALVLAPTVWTLSGVGFTQNLTGRARGDGTIEVLSGFLLLLLAGAAYAILLLPRLSPAGPAAAGVLYLTVCVWVLNDPGSFHGLWPAAMTKPGFDLTLPADGLAALLAVPLLGTTLSRRRWRESRHEPLDATTRTFVWPFARPAHPGTLVVPGVTDLPTPDATQVIRPATTTQVLPSPATDTQALPSGATATQALPPADGSAGATQALPTQAIPRRTPVETPDGGASHTQILPGREALPAPASTKDRLAGTLVGDSASTGAGARAAPQRHVPASGEQAGDRTQLIPSPPALTGPASTGGDVTQVVPSPADAARLPQQPIPVPPVADTSETGPGNEAGPADTTELIKTAEPVKTTEPAEAGDAGPGGPIAPDDSSETQVLGAALSADRKDKASVDNAPVDNAPVADR